MQAYDPLKFTPNCHPSSLNKRQNGLIVPACRRLSVLGALYNIMHFGFAAVFSSTATFRPQGCVVVLRAALT